MRLTWNKQELLACLDAALGFVQGKGTHPVFECVLLDALMPGSVVVSATDAEVSTRFVATRDIEVQEAGRVCVPARILRALVALLEGSRVTIATDEKAPTVRAFVGDGKFSTPMTTCDPKDFPIEERTREPYGPPTIPVGFISEAARSVAFAAASTRDRLSLHAVRFETSPEKLCAVATDGRHIAAIEWASDHKNSGAPLPPDVPRLELLVPSRFPRIATRVLSYLNARTVSLTVLASPSGRVVLSTPDGSEVTTRAVDGGFPTWRQAFQTPKPRWSVLIEPTPLLSALRRAEAVRPGRTDPEYGAVDLVRLLVVAGVPAVTLHGGRTGDGSYEDVPTRDEPLIDERAGGDLCVRLDIARLSAALEVAAESSVEVVTVQAGKSTTPVVVRAPQHDGWSYALMPWVV